MHLLYCVDMYPVQANMNNSFRSTNANPQDFVPLLRYIGKKERTAVALAVRERRDRWLAAMLDKVRDSLPMRTGTKKCVAEMLLTDKDEGLTKRKYREIVVILKSPVEVMAD